jgi:hypothetical protein
MSMEAEGGWAGRENIIPQIDFLTYLELVIQRDFRLLQIKDGSGRLPFVK